MNLSPVARGVWFAAASLLLGALFVLGGAAVTRGGRRGRSEAGELTFYGHAARHASPADLELALRSARYGEAHDLRRAATRLWNLARVLARKKVLLRWGLIAAASGALACIAGGLMRGV